MPTAIIAGPTIVRVGWTIHSPIAVPITIVRRISAIVGWGISAIVTRTISAVVAIARAIPVGVRSDATDKCTCD
jgi:hypothetical protein